MYIYMCVYKYMYVYIYTHTHCVSNRSIHYPRTTTHYKYTSILSMSFTETREKRRIIGRLFSFDSRPITYR